MSDLDGVVLLSNSSVNKTFMQQYDLSNSCLCMAYFWDAASLVFYR